MTETTARIRWEEIPEDDETIGYVGTLPSYVFLICDDGEREWLLSSRLPDGEGERCARGTLDGLKAEAERWLSEFAFSLGAVFPGEPVTDDQRWQVGEARSILAAWDRDRGGENIYGTERMLASQVRALLAILDQVAPDEPAPSVPGTEG